jgi:hypothetical protein
VKNDLRDWVIIIAVSSILIAATVYLFMYPGSGTFGIWAGVASTVVTGYHLINTHDAKVPDASQQ